MSYTITIQQAAGQLAQLIGSLGPDDEIVLTEGDHPVARIVPSLPIAQRRPGNCKGMLIIHAEDDEHLEAFKEYMP